MITNPILRESLGAHRPGILLPDDDRGIVIGGKQKQAKASLAAWVILASVGLVAAGAAAPAGAQEESTPADRPGETLELVGPSEAKRTVEVTESQAQSAGSPGAPKSGTLEVAFYNPADKGGTLDLTYRLLERSGVEATVIAPARIGGRAVRFVTVEFSVPPEKPPTALNGFLVASVERGSGNDSPPRTVTVTGAARKVTGVSFAPADVTLRQESWAPSWFGGSGSDETAEVLLRGEGLGAVLAAGAIPQTVIARSDRGDQVEIILEQGEVLGANSAVYEITTSGKVPPGTYAGQVPLTSFGESPAVTVKIESRDMIIWPILLVLIGSVLGGWQLPRFMLRRAKRSIAKTLRDAVDEYEVLRRRGQGPNRKERPAAWNLDSLIGEGHLVGWETRPDHATVLDYQGALGLYWSVREARTPDELERDRIRVESIVAAIGAWRKVEVAAERLDRAVADRQPLAPSEFLTTRAWKTTIRALGRAGRTPAKTTDPDALADQLDRQRDLFERACDLWTASRATTPSPSLSTALGALRASWQGEIDNRFPESGVPDLDQFEALLAEMRAQWQKLELEGDARALVDNAEAQRSTDDSLAVALAASKPAAAGELREVPGLMPGLMPSFALAQLPLEATQPPVPAGARARGGPAPSPRRWQSAVARIKRTGITRDELVWTLLGAAVGSTAYVLTVYDSDWGTATEYLTAFVAGFASPTVVRWAELPVQQSLRLASRVAGAKPSEQSDSSSKPQPEKAPS